MMANPNRILVLENNRDNVALISVLLASKLDHFEIQEIFDAATFATEVAHGNFLAIITEFHLDWMDGIKVIQSVKSLWPKRPVILVTKDIAPEHLTDALRAGLDGYVSKESSGYVRLPTILLELLERQTARQSTDGLYQRLIEGLPEGIFSGNRRNGITQFNRSLAQILGETDPAALHGKDLDEYLLSGDSRTLWQQAIKEGKTLQQVESKILRADGEIGWIRLNVRPFQESAVGAMGYEGTVTDITEYVRARAELIEREEAMKRSRNELEHIPYIVSHDLQEPLQIVSRYAVLLKNRLAAQGDAEINRFVQHLIDSGERMQERIDDVLRYSRIGTRTQPLKPVDLGQVIEEVRENLKLAIEEAGAKIVFHVLPVVTADRSQMVLLFENLIGNAIKFAGDKPPVVQLLAMEQGEAWVISVKDNGIGINPRYHEKIFLMFQRLHSASEVPGTGIGLAICKKIIDNHGGKIWVDSTPGEGSTFHVSLPMRESGFPKGWITNEEKSLFENGMGH